MHEKSIFNKRPSHVKKVGYMKIANQEKRKREPPRFKVLEKIQGKTSLYYV